MNDIPEPVRKLIRNTARRLKGYRKREFIAEVTLELLDGNARKAEREFGWGRETVRKGIRELVTCIRCIDNYSARGNKRTEERLPHLAGDIRRIVCSDGQVNPEFEACFNQGKITPKAVRQVLIREFGYPEQQLPNVNTIGNILNRLGYGDDSVSGQDDIQNRSCDFYKKAENSFKTAMTDFRRTNL